MITEKELSALELSPVKSDFYQIWNELIDVAGKLSERWDPSSTNESDPGIVLLKVLTGIADKLNYNIDKNILEAFMPSAAQTESMRKLCDMLGYSMKYYQSAETTVTVTYNKKTDSGTPSELTAALTLPKFTNFQNTDKDVNYVTTKEATFSSTLTSQEIPCIEGQLVQCTSDSSGDDSAKLITVNQLDDQHRYYLPEAQIAENGIFVYSIDSDGNETSNPWTKVNLLSVNTSSSDVNSIYKFGYDSKESLPYIQFREDVSDYIENGLHVYYIRTSGVNGNISATTLSTFNAPSDWTDATSDDFVVVNKNAAMNGANPESIENAYENYKKTIGTFDALITCRDYMNKIYSLVDDINIPLCSNIKVSDIRNDINRSQVLCSFNNYGINYIEQATKLEDNTDSIDSFTLMLYPFKTIYSTASKTEYDNSFKYTADKYNEITQSLTDYKTICHKFKTPAQDELTCIKNYLRLDARITTTSKVNSAEEAAILVNVRKAIYENFNMRKLDFGQEIPFDSILNVIESADTRIKSVSLDEPTLCTEFQTADGNEYALASLGSASATDAAKIKELYNKLTVRNILAGRVSLFKYDTSFKAEFDEGKYDAKDIKPIYPEDDNTTGIKRIRGICTLPVSAPVTLTEGEVAKFRFPSIRTTITYSAYTNYFLKLSTDSEIPAKAAKMMTLGEFLENNSDFWNNLTTADVWSEKTAADSDIVSLKTKYIKIYNEDHTAELTTIEAGTNYTYIDLSQETHVSNFNNVLKNFAINDSVKYSGLYRASSSSTGVHGKLVDEDNTKYLEVTRWVYTSGIWYEQYFVQDVADGETNDYGLGIDAENSPELTANRYYQLQNGEFLFINYTQSNTVTNDDSTTTTTDTVVNKLYGPGTIIKSASTIVGSNRSTSSPSKTTGYVIPTSWELCWYDAAQIPTTMDLANSSGKIGLMSLSANEQLEICTPNAISFSEMEYFYPVMNSDEHLTQFDNSTGTESIRYTLEDGEYLYYTDQYMLSYAYFGPGTEITIPASVNIKPTETTITASDIVTSGISVIPWVKYTPINATEDKQVSGLEYKYLTLTSGDILSECNVTSGELDETWRDVTGDIKYIMAGTSSTVGSETIATTKADFSNGDSTHWQAISCLAISSGPTVAQTMYHDYDALEITTQSFITGTHDWDNTATETTIKVAPLAIEGTVKPITFKTNYSCTAGVLGTNTEITEYNAAESDYTAVNDFKVKCYSKTSFGLGPTSTTYSQLNNLADHWTSLQISRLQKTENGYFRFNVNLPDDNHVGLLLVYVNSENGALNGKNYTDYIRIEDKTNSLAICNKCTNTYAMSSDGKYEFGWWDNMSADTHYCLKNGLNILWITKSGSYDIYPCSTSKSTSGIIILGELDLIDISADNNYGINLDQLDYNLWSVLPKGYKTDAVSDLFNKISKTDTDNKFYYNNLADNSNMIDFNDYDLTEQSLSDPRIWYDVNNINNEFVISEIDSDYLASGVRIARSSKLK